MNRRDRLLAEWAGYIDRAARAGQLTGKPCALGRAYTVDGPRAGAIEMLPGLEAGALLRALKRDDCAKLRQFIPWRFTGEPQAFMAGRYLRVEAGWSDDLAETMIPLKSMGKHPLGDGRWVAGKNEYGQTIRPSLSNLTPHFLVSGASGSGKSVALRSAVLQLSADPDNAIVLADGKAGESLKVCERLPGVVGPCAVEVGQIRAALGWACSQMRARYEAGTNGDNRLVVVFDEFQEYASDEIIADLMRKVAAQGRAADVHLLAATQHPSVGSFGHTSTRRNLAGKAALRVDDPDASRVAVGASSPRADHLLGAGDCYVIKPGAVHRVQMAYVDEADIAGGENGHTSWRFTRWPEYDALAVGQELPEDNTVAWHYTGDELAVSIVVAAEGKRGRPTLVKRLEDAELGTPGSPRAARLLQLGRDTHDWLTGHGYAVCTVDNSVEDPRNVRIAPVVW